MSFEQELIDNAIERQERLRGTCTDHLDHADHTERPPRRERIGNKKFYRKSLHYHKPKPIKRQRRRIDHEATEWYLQNLCEDHDTTLYALRNERLNPKTRKVLMRAVKFLNTELEWPVVNIAIILCRNQKTIATYLAKATQ